ncbi:MAG: type 1 glutamine amidotransferase [Synechococcus sp.]
MCNVGLIDCGSKKIQRLAAIVEENNCQICSIPLAEANEYDFTKLDGIVISGGPHLFTDRKTYTVLIQQFEFLDSLQLPTLGICLGHQALAIRHGSSAFLGAERRGTEAIEVVSEHELFYELPAHFSVTEDHCEGITLPPNFQLLASSAHYKVEAMASSVYPHFGVQFHPEVSGEVGEIVIHNFCNLIEGADRNTERKF